MKDEHDESGKVVYLPRGGTVVQTAVGPVQFGIPPETIKDSLTLKIPVPQIYVVPPQQFHTKIGSTQGLNLAEFEFPAYFNFFICGQKRIILIVDSEDVKNRIKSVFQETLLGPREWNPDDDFADKYPVEKKPLMLKELAYFRKFGDKQLSVDLLIHFVVFGEKNKHEAMVEIDGKIVRILRTVEDYVLIDDDGATTRLPCETRIPASGMLEPLKSDIILRNVEPSRRKKPFIPPRFGVTVLGSSHGFDPTARTSGYVVWINHRGIMVDPPPNSTRVLQNNLIPALLIDAVIVTHCHADHDAGTFQKILQEGKVKLITTPTIMGCFLRKYSALSGLDIDFLKTVFNFRPCKIGRKMNFRGGTLSFFYTLHSIPCVGFEAFYGGKSIVISADHMNDPARIEDLYGQGILTRARRDELLNFPWHRDLVLHEAGVPPIHTPMSALEALSDDIKKRLYLVHVGANSVPEGSGLRVAQSGVENTIEIEDVEEPPFAEVLQALDLINSIEIFSDLGLHHADDIFAAATKVHFNRGDSVCRKGEEADFFYIVQAGLAEVKVERRRSFTAEVSSYPPTQQSTALPANGAAYFPVVADEDSVEETSQRPTRARAETDTTLEASSRAVRDKQLKNSIEASPVIHGRRSTQFRRKMYSEYSQKKDGLVEMDHIEGVNDDMMIKTFSPGDYFGEQALFAVNSQPRRRTASIVALTDLTLLKFEKEALATTLEDTGIPKKLKHLASMREKGIWDTIERNSVLRLLSPGQKTQLETYFSKMNIRKGDLILKKGDIAHMAILVCRGELEYTEPRWMQKKRNSGIYYDAYKSSRSFGTSSFHTARASLYSIASEPNGDEEEMQEFLDEQVQGMNGDDNDVKLPRLSNIYTHLHSAPQSVDDEHAEEHSNDDEDDGNSQPFVDFGLRQRPKKLKKVVFRKGAFIADVDALRSDGRNISGLLARENGSVFVLEKKDLNRFFRKNPGVLLSMLHTQFVV